MIRLNVFLEMNGSPIYVGKITGESSKDAVFSYDTDFVKKGVPISVSLPLQVGNFSPAQTRNFFEGLLPEGFTRKTVAQWMQLDEDDYLSILSGLGRECLGALRILQEDEKAEDEFLYQKLSSQDVKKLAAEGATRSAKIVVTSHLSLTGASGKVGLYWDDREKCWYQPIGIAPSTHIVKQSHVRFSNIVENEQLVLRTASKLGIPVARSFIVRVGSEGDDSVLLATKRYDRDIVHAKKYYNEMPIPLRLHQEDFAQALGIPSTQKYEKDGDHYLTRIFQLLRNTSSNPLQDQMTLLDLLIFDFLIGNTDNHIKNLSLLYGPDMRTIRLAPAYDLVSTLIYKGTASEMSIAIAGEKSWNRISRDTFAEASEEIGITKERILREFARLREGIRQALIDSAEELSMEGFKNAQELCAEIMNTCQLW